MPTVAAARPLLESPFDETPFAWTPDGKGLLAEVSRADGSYPLVLHPIAGRGDRVLVERPFAPDSASVSPDGRWLAFDSNHSAVLETYAQPLDGGGAAQRISRRGGGGPSWSPDGRWIHYVAGKKILRAEVRPAGNRLEVGEEETIAEASFVAVAASSAGKNDESLLVAFGPAVEPPTELLVVMSWQREVEEKLAGER